MWVYLGTSNRGADQEFRVMNYQDFVCPECKNQSLQHLADNLHCPKCGLDFPLIDEVPLLFPQKESIPIENINSANNSEASLNAIKGIYDRAYVHEGIMGTDLDKNYDKETKKILLDFAGPLHSKRLLDLGTGVGSLWDYVQSDVIGYAIDISLVGASKALQRKPDLTVSASVGEHLPYPNDFFDVVIAADTIEHTFSPKQTFTEIWRVLKPGGILSASFPIPDSLRKWGKNQVAIRNFQISFLFRLIRILAKRIWLFGSATFQPIDRDYSIKDWINLVESVGFVVHQNLEWPNSPQIPIVYLVQAQK
jgi:SAM-dependent methyltransferase/uncharacterized protein YbaR (Trm112 family)